MNRQGISKLDYQAIRNRICSTPNGTRSLRCNKLDISTIKRIIESSPLDKRRLDGSFHKTLNAQELQRLFSVFQATQEPHQPVIDADPSTAPTVTRQTPSPVPPASEACAETDQTTGLKTSIPVKDSKPKIVHSTVKSQKKSLSAGKSTMTVRID